MSAINLADAKARFSELVDRAAGGDSVDILRRGKAVARITPPSPARKPIDLAALQALTNKMPMQTDSAADFIRGMRDGDRY